MTIGRKVFVLILAVFWFGILALTTFTEHSNTKTEIKPHTTKPSCPTIEVRFAPGKEVEEEVIKRINEAKSEIRVLAYNFSSPQIRDALIAASKRLVTVQCVIDRVAVTERGCIIPALADVGILCFVDKHHRIAHQKVMIIDKEIVLVGSYNWSESAEHNSESMLTISSTIIAETYLVNWNLHKDHSITYKEFLRK